MTRDQIARARQLIAELSVLLDQLEGEERHGRAAKALRAKPVPLPERKASSERKDSVRRAMRRIGAGA